MQDRRIAGSLCHTTRGITPRQFQRAIKHDQYHSSPYLTANRNLGHDQENFVMTKNCRWVWTNAG